MTCEPCCRRFEEAERTLSRRLSQAKRRREAVPSTISEADWLDIWRDHRIVGELREEHGKLHRRLNESAKKLQRMEERLSRRQRRMSEVMAQIYSHALDDAMEVIATRHESVIIRDDPDRVPSRVIANCVYDWFKVNGEWPTPAEAAQAVSEALLVTPRAAAIAIERHFCKDYAAAQTLVLAGPKYQEATPQGERDVWRLCIHDRDWAKHQRRWAGNQIHRDYEAVVQRWVDELTQETPDMWTEAS